MKKILLFLVLTISGCSATNIKPLVNKYSADGETIVLTNSCDSQCLKLISDSFKFNSFSNFLGTDKPIANYVVLTTVDGVKGKKKYFDPNGAFNNSWNGNFEVITSPGLTSIGLRPSSYTAAPYEHTFIEFQTTHDSKYFIGSMGWRDYSSDNSIYIKHWHPVIVNLKKNEVVYPITQPKWKKYCFNNREFGGYVECPTQP